MATTKTAAARLCQFIDASPSPFHAVKSSADRLRSSGFKELREGSAWDLTAGGSYFFTRNGSSLLAFTVGGKAAPGAPFAVVGAHTDSPNLQVKPVSRGFKHGYVQARCMVYGGLLIRTYFDRDLTVAGRVLVRDGDRISGKLLHVPRPIARVSSLAIHLDRTQNEKLNMNKEDHLVPMLAAGVESDLGLTEFAGKESTDKHAPGLLNIISEELGCKPEDIVDFELSVVDTQPCAIGGAREDFVFAPRLDNLCMSFSAVEGIIDSLESAPESEEIRMIALFDHEEVGSVSTQGAGSTLMLETMKRITSVLAKAQEDQQRPADLFETAVRKSFLVSADMAHAIHPCYASKHEENHRPRMGEGIVIKFNQNQRYATSATTAAVVREVAAHHNIPVAEVCVKNDAPCGSTIGPTLAANAGMRVVDIGISMLSMHSIREVCGTHDVQHSVDFFREFFNEFAKVNNSIDAESTAN